MEASGVFAHPVFLRSVGEDVAVGSLGRLHDVALCAGDALHARVSAGFDVHRREQGIGPIDVQVARLAGSDHRAAPLLARGVLGLAGLVDGYRDADSGKHGNEYDRDDDARLAGRAVRFPTLLGMLPADRSRYRGALGCRRCAMRCRVCARVAGARGRRALLPHLAAPRLPTSLLVCTTHLPTGP